MAEAPATDSSKLKRATTKSFDFGFGKFQIDLSEHLSYDLLEKLAILFEFPPAKFDKVRYNNLEFVRVLREEGIISPTNIEVLLNALKSIGQKGIATILKESFERIQARTAGEPSALLPELQTFTTPYDDFVASLSTHLVPAAIEKIYQHFKLPDGERSTILRDVSRRGLLCLQNLHKRSIINSSNVKALIDPLTNAKLVQAVAKVNEYERNIRLFSCREQDSEITLKEKLMKYVKAKLESCYETMTPIPWKKSCKWTTADLFISRRLILREDTTGKTTSCKIKYCDILKHNMLANEERIIIDGEPGAGKTLLSTQIAYDWCRNKISGTDFLVFMPLKLVESAKLSRAIKMFYVPEEDNEITESDIENVLTDETLSCCLLLDGLEEYTGGKIGYKADSSEVTKIIRKEKYPKCKVVITARTDFARDVQGCSKLTISGFGNTERVDYVRKVFPEDDEKQEQILSDITRNELIQELCAIPLLFVLAVHNLGSTDNAQNKELGKVTPFMKAMVEAMCPQDEKLDSSSLQKLAFEGLCSGTQQLTWPKEDVTKKVENAGRWIESGILVIEENVTPRYENVFSTKASYQKSPVEATETVQYSSSYPATSQNISMQRTNHIVSKMSAEMVPMRIRFLHKVVQEWYSAKHLSTLTTDQVKASLQKINPADLHFILRFTCGLNWKCTDLILHHLSSQYHGSDGRLIDFIRKVFYDCYAEHDQSKDAISLTEIISAVCSGDVSFFNKDSRLSIHSKATFLKQAYDLGIPIKEIKLEDIAKVATVLASGGVPMPNALSVDLNDDDTENLMGVLRLLLSDNGRLQQLTLKVKGKAKDVKDGDELKWLNFQGSLVVAIVEDTNTEYVLNTTTGKWKLLKGIEGMIDSIAKKINSRDWKIVGRELGLDEDDLNNIEIDNHRNTHQMKVCMLQKWRQRAGHNGHVVTLILALRKCEFNKAADELSQIFDIPTHVANDN